MKIKVGIFFGGPSREREISFAGGRTVYDNLDRRLFDPVPIFVDSARNFILLDWQYVYKGSIRDFYPPVQSLPYSPNGFQIYEESLHLSTQAAQQMAASVGRVLHRTELAQHVDVAFLALHGEYGEDGQLQQELTNLGIPYTGSGVAASALGMNKALQKEEMQAKGFAAPRMHVLGRKTWLSTDVHGLYANLADEIGFPLVVRPANQGSSIGVSIVDADKGLLGFEQAVNRAFFREILPLDEWQDRNPQERVAFVRQIGDLRDGIGFPLTAQLAGKQATIFHPEELLKWLNAELAQAAHLSQVFVLEGHHSEQEVIVESFIRGKEFSCIVIRTEDGSSIALPPTEIIKGGEVFDYRSKYLPGLSRKETPINLPDAAIEKIRRECERLFGSLGFQVYARIDGFYTEDGQIFLNDPNTTSGMLPSSFFFHQAAEIGLNPSQFLTFITRISLQERLKDQPDRANWQALLHRLDSQLQALQFAEGQRQRVAVVLGGYSAERHISVESGRNIFEKLASSERYEPVPVFLSGSGSEHKMHILPINLLLKDNADDIRDKIAHWKSHPLLEKIRKECAAVTQKYASKSVVFAPKAWNYDDLARNVSFVFIALHGRPGEDGAVQMQLDARNVPYNGSGVASSSLTIDKFRTLQLLAKNGLPVAKQLLLTAREYQMDSEAFYRKVEQELGYPLVAKPVDDGCSAAVKVIRNRSQLEYYTRLIYNFEPGQNALLRERLGLKPKEEFPVKTEILFEELISKGSGIHFLEVTGGMLTSYDAQGNLVFEMFEPSETLASGEVLSLEEKFLAGEGQNLTPARLAPSGTVYTHAAILGQVQATLEKAAKLAGVEGYCRIDAFVRVLADGKTETQVIEINSLPGMTPATAIFHQAALAGYKPADFIDKLIRFGMERQQRKGIAANPNKPEAAPAVMVAPAAMPQDNTRVEQPVVLSTPTVTLPPVAAAPLSAAVAPAAASTQATTPSSVPSKRSWMSTIFSMYIFKNVGAIVGMLVLLLIGLNACLSIYTQHGYSVQVENYVGMSLKEATRKAKDRGFKVDVTEASFSDEVPVGQVIDQMPAALKRIKPNRTIYLTIIGQPRTVRIPSFQDAADDYNQYIRRLNALEIKSKVKERIFDEKLAPNTILYCYYKGRKFTPSDVRRGIEVEQGSVLEFVISKTDDDNVRLPSLRCKRYSEVMFLLQSLDLRIGDVEGAEGPNQDDAYVIEQDPVYVPGKTITRGSTINIVLQKEKPSYCVEVEESPEDEESSLLDDGTTTLPDSTGGQ